MNLIWITFVIILVLTAETQYLMAIEHTSNLLQFLTPFPEEKIQLVLQFLSKVKDPKQLMRGATIVKSISGKKREKKKK